MMPKRRHTRAHNTTKAKAAERRLNDPLVAERNKPPTLLAKFGIGRPSDTLHLLA